MKRLALLFFAVAAMALVACQNETPATPQAAPATTQTTPMSSPMSAGQRAGSIGLTWDLPPGWTSETPSSEMRVAQAQIPGEAGNGTLVVFFFGPGGGGGVDANLDRWEQQMENASPAVKESFQSGDYKITWIDIKGTLMPSMMGAGPSAAQPDSRMYAAVVEGQGGPWFFKATGPEATMESMRDPFLAMLRSVRSDK